MELTNNDRQRIEHKAKRYPNEDMSFADGYIIGAEYATIYEREQGQHLVNVYKKQAECAIEKIDELKTLLTEYVNDTGAVQTNHKARVMQVLNSLKNAELIARAPELLQQVAELTKENERLKADNKGLKQLVNSLSCHD